jgi:transposase
MKKWIEDQYEMLLIFDEKIDKLDIQIEQISKQDEVCQRLQKIEGIRPITALAIIALVGNGQGLKNGRHFSAYLGLVPRQHSSGQKEKRLGISKRGDTYL